MNHYDVIILGRGIAGLSAALSLVRKRKKVLVIGRLKNSGEASPAAAGILDPFLGKNPGNPYLKLCLRAFEFYPDFLRQFGDLSDASTPYRKTGLLIPAFDARGLAELKKRLKWQGRFGIQVEWLAPKEAIRLESSLSPEILGALYYPGIGRIQPRKLLDRMEKKFLQMHGHLLLGRGKPELIQYNDRAMGIKWLGSRYSSFAVLDAMGAWVNDFLGMSAKFKVAPVRGQLLEMKHSGLKLQTTIHSVGDHYIVPWEKETFVLGSTVETSGFSAVNTQKGYREIVEGCSELTPTIREAKIVSCWSGLRPRTFDGLPLIGKTRIQGVYLATGYFRSGILSGPYIGKLLAEAVLGGPIPTQLRSFSPLR